ncbi:MAG TPA: hypothetical protein DCD96_01605 [Flavobacteriales bacterium]|nr:hypothetical protein [Flavobacteriales bacterium]HRE74123.1 Wzz/FepE/Etk N-terminal domain-containing protein [Flavobacteriales bacterium]HRJ35457.1 Wzz/FepE/Etk N-terminal domain-containing protein [Flavobacteriales bacterium]HRJ39428.1 Wzz/FepE/Etk N-terminal domain-containing protein [Flavobacteriales bacterium]
MTNPKPAGDFSSTTLLLLLWKWRMRIIIVMGVTVVVSSVVALMIREKYKSTAIIFPAKSSSIVLGKMLNPSQGILQFGEEEEAEQVLQILNSSQIRDQIISKYNLMQHYEIDTASKFKNTELVKEYEDNVKCSRTRYGSVTIEVLDYHPDTAALIANDIARLLDSAKNKMLQDRGGEAFRVVEQEFLALKSDVDALNDTLTKLGEMGVIGSSAGVAALYEAQANAIQARNELALRKIDEQINLNKKYGAAYSSFLEQRELKNMRLDEMEGTYLQARADAYSNVSHHFDVEQATPAEKKSYPVRWLIVFISVITSFFFMIFFIIALEKIRELRQMA